MSPRVVIGLWALWRGLMLVVAFFAARESIRALLTISTEAAAHGFGMLIGGGIIGMCVTEFIELARELRRKP